MRLVVMQRPLFRRRSLGEPTPIHATGRDYADYPPIAQMMLGLIAVGLVVLVVLWYAV